MSIDNKIEIHCSEGLKMIENIYNCQYKGDCDQKLIYGYGLYCRKELYKAKQK